jgi:hypothetical protein
MIAMTTSSSMRVNPRTRPMNRNIMALPRYDDEKITENYG